MDATLKQVGELLLGAIPTVIFLTLLYFLYTLLVHRPLARVLGERRNLTSGAVDRAKADIAAAETRTAEYERKLRDARLALFKAQEERRQAIVKARDAAVAEARAQAQAQIATAKAAIDQDRAVAQASLQAESERLAGEIVRAVLRPAGAFPGGQA
jgi:F-type H+-transporting ATPase subunit b